MCACLAIEDGTKSELNYRRMDCREVQSHKWTASGLKYVRLSGHLLDIYELHNFFVPPSTISTYQPPLSSSSFQATSTTGSDVCQAN
jgi:hypothetical protein